MDVNHELISRYADGEISPEEARTAEEALARDPSLASDLEDFRLVAELFGHVEPEEVSDGLTRRLHALDAPTAVEGFRLVPKAPAPPRASWAARAAAVAAVALLAVGVLKLGHRPEVTLLELSRVRVAPDGTMNDIRRIGETKLRSGDTVRAAADERVSFRTRAGDRVTLLPGGSLRVGDPLDGEIFELDRGTALCSVLARDEPETVRAGPYRIRVSRKAHFGVRIDGAEVRPAGAGPSGAEVTVTVSLGAVEVFRNGDPEVVQAYERATFSPRGKERTHAATDPVYVDLMRSYRDDSREIVPGFFTGEPGVSTLGRWQRQGDSLVVALSDEGQGALGATHLVLKVRASEPGPLRLTLLRPLAGRPGEAEATTVATPPVGLEWTVVAVPRAAFDAPDAERATRVVGESSSRLVRLKLAPSSPRARVEVQVSLWAARPPVELPEVVR
jgi:hypothetical protein